MRHVRVTIVVVVEKQDVVHILSFCGVRYAAWKSACAVLYSNMWAVCFYHIFPYYLQKKELFLKNFFHEIWVLIICTTLV
jgi:hypothetical protein